MIFFSCGSLLGSCLLDFGEGAHAPVLGAHGTVHDAGEQRVDANEEAFRKSDVMFGAVIGDGANDVAGDPHGSSMFIFSALAMRLTAPALIGVRV